MDEDELDPRWPPEVAGVILDSSMGGGRPLGVASKSDKLKLDSLGLPPLWVIVPRDLVVVVSFFLSSKDEGGISWILVGLC